MKKEEKLLDSLISSNKKINYIVGIDEAGRGPVAGPVCVGLVVIKRTQIKKYLGIKDSKQISEKNRSEIFHKLLSLKKIGELNFCAKLSNAATIDKKGIQYCIRHLISQGLKDLRVNFKNTLILLDGLLYAPSEFKFQQTLIKGDERVSIIALASIVAKVSRDQKMIQYSKKYPEYKFNKHKGYGTADHLRSIRKNGLSPLHRKTYLKKVIEPQ